jgi:hypothetical protein
MLCIPTLDTAHALSSIFQAVRYPLRPKVLTPHFGIPNSIEVKSWIMLGQKSCNYAMIGAQDPCRMDHTSIWVIYKVIHSNHLQLMGIWICHHSVTTSLVVQEFRIWLKTWVTTRPKIMQLWNDWGSRPMQNGSYIHLRHMQSGWKWLYAVDRCMH